MKKMTEKVRGWREWCVCVVTTQEAHFMAFIQHKKQQSVCSLCCEITRVGTARLPLFSFVKEYSKPLVCSGFGQFLLPPYFFPS